MNYYDYDYLIFKLT